VGFFGKAQIRVVVVLESGDDVMIDGRFLCNARRSVDVLNARN